MPSTLSETSTSTQSFANVTFLSSDSALQFSGSWSHSKSSKSNDSTLASSTKTGDSVFFYLPANATALYYFGQKRAQGGTYSACIDCDIRKSSDADHIDAHATKADSNPTLLFAKINLDPTSQHSFALINVPDTRFHNSSTITVQSLVVTVQNQQRSDSQVASATPSATGMQAALTSNIVSPASASASISANALATEASTKATGYKLMIAGIVIGVLVFTSTVLFAVMYFRRRVKRRKTAPYGADPEHWAIKFFGEKGGTRRSVFGGEHAVSTLELRRLSKSALNDDLRRPNMTDGGVMASRPGHVRRATEEALLPNMPFENSSSSTFLDMDPYAQVDVKALPDPPPTSPPPSYKARQSLGRLSIILRQQLGSTRLRSSSRGERPPSLSPIPTRSLSHSQMQVSSPLARNPPWTYATLSHIRAQGPARQIQRNASISECFDSRIPRSWGLPSAPDLGFHVAEACARVRERAQLGAMSRAPDDTGTGLQDTIMNRHGADGADSVSMKSESLIDGYNTTKD